jgi:hypothetical protein
MQWTQLVVTSVGRGAPSWLVMKWGRFGKSMGGLGGDSNSLDLNPFASLGLYKGLGYPLRSVESSTQLLLVLRPDLARY